MKKHVVEAIAIATAALLALGQAAVRPANSVRGLRGE